MAKSWSLDSFRNPKMRAQAAAQIQPESAQAAQGTEGEVEPTSMARKGVAEVLKKRSKYGAVRTEQGGKVYASAKEAAFAAELAVLKAAGEVKGWLEQVSFGFECGVTYRADFLIFYADGRVRLVDTKGFSTPEFKIKQKLMAAEYSWLPLEVV